VQRRPVVDAVAGDRDDVPTLLPPTDEVELVAIGATSWSRARTARSAVSSLRTPRVVLTSTTSVMTRASVWSPVATVRAMAASSTRTSGSASAQSTRRHKGTGCGAGRRLGPKRCNHSAASSGVNPAGSRSAARNGGTGAVTTQGCHTRGRTATSTWWSWAGGP
jgi:hypothetical protein